MFRESVYTLLAERGYPVRDAQTDAYREEGVWLATQIRPDRLRLTFDTGFEYLVPGVESDLNRAGYATRIEHHNFDTIYIFNKEN